MDSSTRATTEGRDPTRRPRDHGSGYPLGPNFRQDVEAKAGGNPSWNTGVDYAAILRGSPYAAEVAAFYQAAGLDIQGDLDRLAAAPRIADDPLAVEFMTEFGQLTGSLGMPLLTTHTAGDGRVIAARDRWE